MITIESQIACVKRELALRRNVYPKLVQQRRMVQKEADAEMQAMEAVLQTLVEVQNAGVDLSQPAAGSAGPAAEDGTDGAIRNENPVRDGVGNEDGAVAQEAPQGRDDGQVRDEARAPPASGVIDEKHLSQAREFVECAMANLENMGKLSPKTRESPMYQIVMEQLKLSVRCMNGEDVSGKEQANFARR